MEIILKWQPWKWEWRSGAHNHIAAKLWKRNLFLTFLWKEANFHLEQHSNNNLKISPSKHQLMKRTDSIRQNFSDVVDNFLGIKTSSNLKEQRRHSHNEVSKRRPHIGYGKNFFVPTRRNRNFLIKLERCREKKVFKCEVVRER